MLALLAISVPTSTAYILPPAFLTPSSLTPSTTRPAFTPPTSLNSRRPPRRYDEDEDYDDDDDTFYDPIASRREGRRAEPRKIAPPTPGFLADLYNRLFWYGLDDEENYIYEEEKKKTVFGGTKGKFNGLNVLGRMREEEFEYEYDEKEYEEYEEEYDDDADDDEEEEEYYDEDVKDWVRREVSGWFDEESEEENSPYNDNEEEYEDEDEDYEEDEDEEDDNPSFRDWRGSAAMPPTDAKGFTASGPSSRSALDIATSERQAVKEDLLEAEDDLARKERKFYGMLEELREREEWISPGEAARERERVRKMEGEEEEEEEEEEGEDIVDASSTKKSPADATTNYLDSL
ncbi:hypothetical protein TL16_g07760 [Triparma laevis f. inornata]|uniref:Uncharacterized protein n=1 Tax=Triparma laevis f. inornata TaxID=1714386 RepID=A0A9W7AYK3_9STRA|nr:hypothetical protein TL16_g07760 [Triparma laevis f. inornata]